MSKVTRGVLTEGEEERLDRLEANVTSLLLEENREPFVSARYFNWAVDLFGWMFFDLSLFVRLINQHGLYSLRNISYCTPLGAVIRMAAIAHNSVKFYRAEDTDTDKFQEFLPALIKGRAHPGTMWVSLGVYLLCESIGFGGGGGRIKSIESDMMWAWLHRICLVKDAKKPSQEGQVVDCVSMKDFRAKVKEEPLQEGHVRQYCRNVTIGGGAFYAFYLSLEEQGDETVARELAGHCD
ncbi:hypothetical protein F4813DRAFT_398510 [Daldinia decipiens]|uniref:uncharacterized protein n=1 Tax=Daldinia decipiens TaxID=326647 RepID=UPI0020C3F1DC|nr:uncharacterized protein F4813DRAFT_398510 [Daldinia decipiens]KAI1655130.1 hypothetical protein F4813DRAFT_398510 [Daldinia decipiens]